MSAGSLIEVSSVRFRWPRTTRETLDIPSFRIEAGERVFLFGPSGSGKSTFLGLLAGVQVPNEGTVRVLDCEVSEMGAAARDRFRVEHIGFIFQQFNLVPYLSVVENVLLPCRFSARRAERAASADGSPRSSALRLLEAMRLGPAFHGRVATALSVGQQQRVAAARALIGRPELIIADEPTSSLDEDVQDAFLDLLLAECERSASTLLFVSHNRRLAGHFHREVDLAEINRALAEPIMRHLLRLAVASAWNRRFTLGLILAALALSVTMLLGVERARNAARESFSQSVSGTDLVVGARTSPIALMLYAVFRLGDATNNMRWKSFQTLSSHPAVAWSIPLSLGDSHKGFPVLGTSDAYFEHFRYGASRPLSFTAGERFSNVFDAVIGAEVADELGYKLGDQVILSHGTGGAGLPTHADKPFTVVGILARTGTPVDRTVHVSLEAIEAIHLDWQGGAPIPGVSIPAQYVTKFDLKPKEITAALIGLKSRSGVFQMQRIVNNYPDEPLMAVLPGVALDDLWRLVGVFERTLLGISAMVIAIGLAGMIAVVWASLGERRRELAILRSVGAGPRDILVLLALEGLLLTLGAVLLGYAVLTLLSLLAAPWIQAHWGLDLPLFSNFDAQLGLMGMVLVAGLLATLLPAWRASRLALADGLTPRI